MNRGFRRETDPPNLSQIPFRISGFRVQGAGFRVQGSGLRVQGSEFRVQGSGFRVQGPGSRVQGSGFWVQGPGSCGGRLTWTGPPNPSRTPSRRSCWSVGTCTRASSPGVLRTTTSQKCAAVPRRARI